VAGIQNAGITLNAEWCRALQHGATTEPFIPPGSRTPADVRRTGTFCREERAMLSIPDDGVDRPERPGLKKFAGMGCEILEVFICGNVLSKYYEIVKHIL